MRYLIDAMLPARLVGKLADAGYEARHVYSVLAPDASDLAVAEEANLSESILLSKDEDFLDLSMRGILRVPFVWLRVGNMTADRVWLTLEPRLPIIKQAIEQGELVIEIS